MIWRCLDFTFGSKGNRILGALSCSCPSSSNMPFQCLPTYSIWGQKSAVNPIDAFLCASSHFFFLLLPRFSLCLCVFGPGCAYVWISLYLFLWDFLSFMVSGWPLFLTICFLLWSSSPLWVEASVTGWCTQWFPTAFSSLGLFYHFPLFRGYFHCYLSVCQFSAFPFTLLM